MLDFITIQQKSIKKDIIEIFPKFIVSQNSKDLMVRGRDFYAVWDDANKIWSLNEDTVINLVDAELNAYKEKLNKMLPDAAVQVKYMWDSDSGVIDKWHKYVQKQMRDNYKVLDNKVIFSNQATKRNDYASKKLEYPIAPGDISAYDELMSTLYDPAEREKLEWAIGAVISGDSKKIQKFIVLYGSAGSGKSTVLNIIQMLFENYYSIFDAKELASSNNSFALESFKNNPLVSIQHDGDLSKIEDNTKINSIVSHEMMEVNEKFKSKYTMKFNTFLFIGTNKPVKITEAKSGLIRRLIDVTPSGRKVDFDTYQELMAQIPFELGAIAQHCLDTYNDMGIAYYNKYIPRDMISATNDFYDFIENYFYDFKNRDGIALREAWDLYKKYCDYANIAYPFNMRTVRTELKNYFKNFDAECIIDGKHYRNYYSGFLTEKLVGYVEPRTPKKSGWINLEEGLPSYFDEECSDCPAQYASVNESPEKKWDDIHTTLNDLDTAKLHYVRVPENHIVIDFDLKDNEGSKDINLNLEAANKFPKTYAEVSKSGHGLHLHYIYDGDVNQLSRIYDDNIEIKVFTGKSALRRKLTKCNDLPISTIRSGLPLIEGGKKMVNFDSIKSEKALRTLIKKNLSKEYHANTKPSVDFIYKILEDAYASGISYDVSDMRNDVVIFALRSTHSSDYCLKLIQKMKFKSEERLNTEFGDDAPIIFYDVEVFPNLFVLNWKYEGSPNVVRMINPKATEVEELFKYKLVGFNNRRYDNHILWAASMGFSNEELFILSQNIINNGMNSMFMEAYNLSYTDVYDFSSKKQSLKKWEIELGIHHQELGLPWDEPVPEELWPKVAEYCDNDVIATEAVFNARKEDFVAREILAELSGLTVNDPTNKHTTQLIVGSDKNPQEKFVYTDLSTIFPGYAFTNGVSSYKGEIIGEGGYVYSVPGMYTHVVTFDVSGMHPASARILNIFGDEGTRRFGELVDARLAIKHKDFESAKKMFDGKLAKYLDDPDQAKALSYALKIAVNSVYGLTAAKFDNKLRDPRNVDNIVAKYGELFMVNLKEEVEKRGFKVIHIKTDSIKIPSPNEEITNFIIDYGKQYGFTFEVESRYERMCLVNDAVYIAKEEDTGEWTATGAQFAQPYVFKSLFSKEPITFEDKCETKSVSTSIYIDMNEDLLEGTHDYVYVGKVGQFCPIKPGCGGGELFREKDGKYYAVGGTKGYRWLESEVVKNANKEKDIDIDYYRELIDKAISDISQFGDFEWFVSDEPVDENFVDIPSNIGEDVTSYAM